MVRTLSILILPIALLTTSASAASPESLEAKKALAFRELDQSLKTVFTQIHALKPNESAVDLGESLKKVLADLKTKDELSKSVTCDVLKGLGNPRDLVLLEDEIEDPSLSMFSECRVELLSRIQKVYADDREELQKKYGPVPNASLKKKASRLPAQANRCQSEVSDVPDLEVKYSEGQAYGSYADPAQNVRGHVRRLPGLKPKEVVFTLDDGPRPGRTDQILRTLSDHCVRATFFLIGQSMGLRGAPQTLQSEIEGGHNIANHTWDHQFFKNLNAEAQVREIARNDQALRASIAKLEHSPENAKAYQLTPFFRFPGGIEGQAGLQYLKDRHEASFTWEAGANDWLPHMSAADELEVAMKELRATRGGVLLIHDRVQASADMMPYLINQLAHEGFKIRHIVPARN